MIISAFATIISLSIYYAMSYYKIKPDYSDLKYMGFKSFYILSLGLILFTGIGIIATMFGEIDFFVLIS